jgi:Anti-sigma-K factor rskA, C-terminal/Anti-sigma-K factor RskA, N-terminal domain
MDRALSPQEIQELLAAYALDAVDDDERAAIERYLAVTPGAADEVAAMQSAAAMLAHVGGPPPEGVWERLESMIAESPIPSRRATAPDLPTVLRPPRSPAHTRRWQLFAAAAAVVALVFAGLWVAELTSGGSATRDMASLARAAEHASGARHAVLRDDAGNAVATAVMLRDGTGYLTSKLARLSAGQTYQLWGVGDTETISLGVLGPKPHIVAFKAAARTAALAISTEVAGGVAVITHAPDAAGDLVPS